MNRKKNQLITLCAFLMLCCTVGCGSSKQAKTTELATSVDVKNAPSQKVDYNDPIVTDANELPKYSGGEEGLRKEIRRKIKYPEEAYKNNIQGKIYCKVVVRRDGTIHDVKLVRRGNFLLEQEALRILPLIPPYKTPAMKDGQAVSVEIPIMVDFSLSNIW